MAVKTFSNAVLIRNGNPTEIDVLSQVIGTGIDRYSRILSATLVLKIAAITGATGFNVEARSVNESKGTETPWEIIDFVSPEKKDDLVHINITEEANCIIKDNNEKVAIKLAGGVTFEQFVELIIEYIPERIMHEGNAYFDVSAGRAGRGKINLATGGLSFIHGDSAASGISHVYNSWQSGKTAAHFDFAGEEKTIGDYGCGKGWKLNLQQYLVKLDGTSTQDLYTYIDGGGNYHELAERFYYKANGTKHYVKKETVNINFDGKMTFVDPFVDNGNEKHEIKTELKTTSGLTLQTDLGGFSGAEKLELRSEDRAQLEADIENLERAKSDCEFALTEYNKNEGIAYKSLLRQQDRIEEDSAELERRSVDAHYLTEGLMAAIIGQKSVLDSYLRKNSSGSYLNYPGSNYDAKLADYKQKQATYEIEQVKYQIKLEELNEKSAVVTQVTIDSAPDERTINAGKDDCKVWGNIALNALTGDGPFSGGYSGSSIYKGPKKSELENQRDAQINLNDAQIDLNSAQVNLATAQKQLTTAQEELNREIDLLQQTIREYSNRIEGLNWEETKVVYAKRAALLKMQDDFRKAKKAFSDADEIRQSERNDELYERTIIDLEKTKNLLEAKKFELEQVKQQEPVRFLSDSSGAILAFNEVGALVAIADAYENVTYIIYENGKIVSVKNNDNKETKFEYESNLLVRIIDADEKVIRFDYIDNMLARATYFDETNSEFNYQNEMLEAIIDPAGYGVRFIYDRNRQIAEVKEATRTYEITGEGLRELDNEESRRLTRIDYVGLSTTLTDRMGDNHKTYIFDILGKPVSVYDGAYEDFGINTKSLSIDYSGSKKAFNIADNILEDNLLEGISPSGTLSGTAATERKLAWAVDLTKIPEGATDFVFSAWAKADSAFIATERKTDYSFSKIDTEHIDLSDDKKKKRKFELRAELAYNDGTIKKFSASFDWLNTGWQYLALPVTITEEDEIGDRLSGRFPFTLGGENRKLQSMTMFFDYSYNTNHICVDLDCVILRQGSWNYSEFDADGKAVYGEDDKGNKIDYIYDERDNLVKSILTDKRHQEFISAYEYDKQNRPVRKVDYNGLCEETVYDSKGRAVRSITYNVSDPTSKFYSESVRDEKGRITADIDVTGEFNSAQYGFDHTGAVNVITDALGNKTAYGYGKTGELVSISGDCGGDENKNETTYTLGYITKVSSGGTEYDYTYDGLGRQKEIYIAGELYCETDYADDYTTKTALGTGEKFIAATDKKGRLASTEYVSQAGDSKILTENYYDKETDFLTHSIDKSGKTEYTSNYGYYNDGRLKSKVEDGNGLNVTTVEQDFTYRDDGAVESNTYTINDLKELYYTYEYESAPAARLSKITLPNDAEQTISYDLLGRLSVVSQGNFTKEICYAKNGDHATNYVNSVWYSNGGKRDENMRYAYDKKGSITEVRENGKDSVKYAYDALGRLIREDNKALGKTAVHSYDNNGNILSKKIYEYSPYITDLETLGEPEETLKYSYAKTGRRDQLLSVKAGNALSDNPQFTYDAIGNPLIYRGKTMTWTMGRNLIEYNGNTYDYNAAGIRTTKTVNGIQTTYYLDGNKIIAEERKYPNTSNIIDTVYYHYGIDGIAGFEYNGNNYKFRKNIQGDITHIYTADGELLVQYAHDAWGNCQAYAKKGYEELAERNPYRYRSYYYDTETKLYYLNSRYYDPEIGRFINADDISYLDPETINGLNLYAYCCNNPVMAIDPDGHEWWNPTTWDWNKIGFVATIVASAAIVIGAVAFSIATFGLGAVVGAAAAGFVIGGLVGGGFELGAQLIAGNGLDWGKIGMAALGGGVAGAISALPGLGWVATFFVGGAASVFGGLISGSVNDAGSALLAFGIGGIANVAAKGVSELILGGKAGAIADLGRKSKSLAVQQLQGHSLNMGSAALKGSMRNAFKDYTKAQIKVLISNANSWIRLGIYSSLTSAGLSSLPYLWL